MIGDVTVPFRERLGTNEKDPGDIAGVRSLPGTLTASCPIDITTQDYSVKCLLTEIASVMLSQSGTSMGIVFLLMKW